MEDLLKKAREGPVRDAVREFNARLPMARQPGWAARILGEFQRRYPACTAVSHVHALALDGVRWAEAHSAFSAVRDLTLDTERSGNTSSLDLYLLAELVAKVTYNASGEDAPFKPTSGLDLAAWAQNMARATGDAALQARIRQLLEEV